MSLSAATRSETTKQFSTSMWWILAIVLVGYIGFAAASLAFVFAAGSTGNLPGDVPPMPTDGLAAILYSSATSFGYVFPLLIGTLMATAEFRHKTLTPTFLATPRRSRVLWAKVAVGVVFGVLYGIIGVASAVLPSAGLLAAYDLDTQLAEPDMWAMFGRMVLAYVLWVVVGIGVGTLVRNQVGAIVGVLVFTQFIEPIARTAAGFLEQLAPAMNYLPGAASDALVGASVYSSLTSAGTAVDPLEWWAGGLVLLGYAAVFLVLGGLFSWRRDVS